MSEADEIAGCAGGACIGVGFDREVSPDREFEGSEVNNARPKFKPPIFRYSRQSPCLAQKVDPSSILG